MGQAEVEELRDPFEDETLPQGSQVEGGAWGEEPHRPGAVVQEDPLHPRRLREG